MRSGPASCPPPPPLPSSRSVLKRWQQLVLLPALALLLFLLLPQLLLVLLPGHVGVRAYLADTSLTSYIWTALFVHLLRGQWTATRASDELAGRVLGIALPPPSPLGVAIGPPLLLHPLGLDVDGPDPCPQPAARRPPPLAASSLLAQELDGHPDLHRQVLQGQGSRHRPGCPLLHRPSRGLLLPLLLSPSWPSGGDEESAHLHTTYLDTVMHGARDEEEGKAYKVSNHHAKGKGV